jgi:hypothetical protein
MPPVDNAQHHSEAFQDVIANCHVERFATRRGCSPKRSTISVFTAPLHAPCRASDRSLQTSAGYSPDHHPPMSKFTCLGPRTVYWMLKAAALLGALGAGLYSCNELIFPKDSDDRTAQWTLLHFYNTLFSVLVTSAEFEVLEHPTLKAAFGVLQSYVGRAAVYVFMGGLLMDGWGYIPGVWLMVVATCNILGLCFFKDQLNKAKADIAFERKQREDRAAAITAQAGSADAI